VAVSGSSSDCLSDSHGTMLNSSRNVLHSDSYLLANTDAYIDIAKSHVWCQNYCTNLQLQNFVIGQGPPGNFPVSRRANPPLPPVQ